MPEMDGIELAGAGRALQPALRCLIMSGHRRPDAAPDHVQWIGKLIDVDVLLDALARCH